MTQQNISKPSLFKYATSELSQDAIICYMLEWARPENKHIDEETHNIGKVFLESLFKKSGKELLSNYQKVEILKQKKFIDILCIVDEKFYIIIEDKVFTSEHSNQLSTYKRNILEKNILEKNILCIYYKTGEEFQKENIESKSYKIFTKEDILSAIPENASNCILADYRSYIVKLLINADYINKPIRTWGTNAGIKFVNEEMSKIEGIHWGSNITNGRGKNPGVFFQYEIITSKGVAFYLRFAFKEKEIQFKIQKEGVQPTKNLGLEFYELINYMNSKEGYCLEIKKSCKQDSNIMIVAKVINTIESKSDGTVDIEATTKRIKQIMDMHKKIIESFTFDNR